RDGTTFTTVATLDQGKAKALLKDNRVRAVRLRAVPDQSEPLVVRAIHPRLLVEVSGVIRNPSAAIGEGNVALTRGNTEFAFPIGTCASPVINQGFTLKFNNGGISCNYSGSISGSGQVEIYAGGQQAPLVLDGKTSNTIKGTWAIKAGCVILAKE